jgi:hypothetical protein
VGALFRSLYFIVVTEITTSCLGIWGSPSDQSSWLALFYE